MPDSRRPTPGAGRPGSRGGPASKRPGSRAGTRPPARTGGPARAERAAGAPATAAAPRQRRFTGRMAILAVVVAVLVVSYASSMRAYLQQKSHIATLRSEIASSSADIARLEREKKRWNDDSYVADQARARFGWVLPGEVAYQVIGKDGKPLETGDRLADPDQVVRTAPTPWWSTQYDSLRKADHPAKKAPTPVGSIKPGQQ